MSWDMYQCLMVAGLFYVMMLEPGILKSYSVIINDMRVDVDISMSSYGLILGVSHGLPCLFGFVNIPLLSRFSYRQTIMTGSLIAAISYTAVSIASSATQLTLCYIGAGLGNIFIYTPAHACPSTYFPDDFEIVNGVLYAGAGVGMIVVPTLTEFLNRTYGWRGAALLLGAFALNMALGGAFFGPLKPQTISPQGEYDTHSNGDETDHVKSVPDDNDAHSDDEEIDHVMSIPDENDGHSDDDETDHLISLYSPDLSMNDYGQKQKQDNTLKNIARFFDLYVLQDHPVVIAGFLLFVVYFVVNNSWMIFVIPNAEAKGAVPHKAVYIAVVGGIANITGRVAFGFLSSLKIMGNDLIICILNAVSGLAFICNLLATELWSLYLLAAVNGFCLGSFITVLAIYLKDLVPIERFKSVIGLAVFFPGIFEPIGSTLFGHIYDVTSSFNLSFVIIGGLQLISIPIALIPRMLNRVQRD